MSTTQNKIYYWPNGDWYSDEFSDFTDVDQYRDAMGLSDDFAVVGVPNTFDEDRIEQLIIDINKGLK